MTIEELRVEFNNHKVEVPIELFDEVKQKLFGIGYKFIYDWDKDKVNPFIFIREEGLTTTNSRREFEEHEFPIISIDQILNMDIKVKCFDLTEILRYCPKGTKLYSPLVGVVILESITGGFEYPIESITGGFEYPIVTCSPDGFLGNKYKFTKEGKYYDNIDGECLLFPSKYQRDWTKFKAPWLKKPKFDPKTLQPFDKVLVRDSKRFNWVCYLLSHISEIGIYGVGGVKYKYCIPYNEDTKHLVGTSQEAPEYYRYWEE